MCCRNSVIKLFLVAIGLTAQVTFAGMFRAGRNIEEGRDTNLRITAGQVTDIQGMVQETQRAFYNVTGRQSEQEGAENYDLNDFGMNGGYPAIGMSLQNDGKYFGFHMDMLVMNPEVDTVAQRNYYIGVGEAIEVNGAQLHNMKIPKGTPFSMDIVGGTLELKGLFTPVTFRPVQGFRFTPSLDLGLFLFAGHYNIDAGPVSGAVQYLYPPEDFAVGGSSSGWLGVGVPEYGLGGEFRFGSEDHVNLVLQGHYVGFNYKGSSSYFASTQEREKNLDLDHVNYRGRCSLEFPLKKGRSFTVGIDYQLVDSKGSITHAAQTKEEILATQERFDKNVTFRMETLMAMAGWTF